jgi:nicotinamidase/pyrazinamidase
MQYADTALIVIDVQNDFCTGGALAVPDGEAVVPLINAMLPDYGACILTQDWHPTGHSSFASQHAGKEPFGTVEMSYGTQVLWPDHCVQGTQGAEFHADLQTDAANMIIRKGFRRDIDSYSAFFENDRTTPTGLTGYLRTINVQKVTLAGLATDFCVAYSALDAARLGFDVTVDLRACRAIDLEGSLEHALSQMAQNSVRVVD